MIQVMPKTTHSLAIASAVSDSFQKDLNLAISICCDNLITWKKNTKPDKDGTLSNVVRNSWSLFGTQWNQYGRMVPSWNIWENKHGRNHANKSRGSVVNFFEWGISREKTPRWLLSIRLNSDDFPAWKLNTYLCYVTIICISRSILYYSTLKKTSRCMQDCIRAYVIISPLLQNNILYTKHRINL